MLLGDSELELFSWSDFVKQIDAEKNAELIAYLKARQLYINDPQTDCEEV